jgi:hypothetical protein
VEEKEVKDRNEILIEAVERAQKDCKAEAYKTHLDLIAGHELDKAAWEAAEASRLLA